MCGIVGIFNFKTGNPVSPKTVSEMAHKIRHRGPDENGVFSFDSIGLGFQRLSIVDVENGQQPMTSNSGRFVIVFNGEIYNYLALKSKFTREGYDFRTNSDTEVILALFELGYEYPERHLEGMFAFAVYDKYESTLVLSRDRAGKKPIFYKETDEGIMFASEQKALMQNLQHFENLNKQAISDFLSVGYLPQPTTTYLDIMQVPRGERIIVSKVLTKSVWCKSFSNNSSKQSYQEVLKNTEILISDAIQKRLNAEVPVGLFLSSGMDSSMILAMIAKSGITADFCTFTVDFDNKNFSEASKAKFVADYFGVPNRSIYMQPSDFIDIFESTVWSADNLLANPATFAFAFLSKEAVKSTKVVLHGGGADELFYGYDTYYANKLAKALDRFPRKLNETISKFMGVLPASHKKLGLDYKLKKFFQSLHLHPLERHYHWRTIFTENEKSLFLSEFENSKSSYWPYELSFAQNSHLNFDEQVSRADFDVWWCSMGNYQADISGMAHGLEMRLPFMDSALREYLYSIPTEYKFSLFQRKKMLHAIGRKILPNDILKLPKSGFHLPFADWFRGPLQSFVFDNLNDLSKNQLIKDNGVYFERMLSDHINKKEDNSFKIINLLVLSKWLSLYTE